ncbi:MAG: hypothetical protein Q9174_004759 [Haloplaca sp. 1 TL-2023]
MHTWVRSLRREICNAADVATAQRRSRESLHAALLCRKTFVLEAANSTFEHAAFACWLECAFTIKDNLGLCDAGYISKMPAALRRLYVSDLKLVHSLERPIRWSIKHLQAAVSEAVNSVWMDAGGSSGRVFSQWDLMPPPRDTWAEAKSIGSDGMIEQIVNFNIVEGTLYIDGQLLGCLPDEFLQQDFFQEFFGNRFFLTRPSDLQGMSHMFVTPFEGHEIHFGFRDGGRFMRVRPRSSMATILEYLPAPIFFGNGVGAPDLPGPLITGCIHWFDIRAHKVEIRPLAMRWRPRPGNWIINLVTGQAWRRNKSLLVDPRSEDFGRIVKLIEPFESRANVIVYQPNDPKFSLAVDLPSLELTFRVSPNGLLTSRQLQAYVDLDQDAGTLYGLRSSLVLRDTDLQDNRSVLVAIGPATVARTETHVDVSIKHTGFYARFSINTVLGRLECAAEPRLLYFKALCHAITSSVHPDPLTKRTGTAEAVSCLQAANAQPWAPLDSESYRILFELANLTPSRVYYPENMRVLQRVLWDDRITPLSQSGQYRLIVEDILQQCAALHRFHLNSDTAPVYKRQGDPHLHARALWRDLGIQATQCCPHGGPSSDEPYKPRDLQQTMACRKAFEVASFTSRWTLDLEVNTDLSTRLQEWPLIQGFDHPFDGHLLSNLIEIDPASNWGSLFRTCQEAKDERDKAEIMFTFATIAFGGQMELVLLRTLTAVAIMEESRTLKLPDCSEFIGYRRNQIPTAEHLAQYVRPHRVPYPGDERALLTVTMHSKQRRKLEEAQKRYETASEADCMTLAGHLVSQWPTRDATIVGLRALPLLDVEEAMLSVRPEWERLADNLKLSKHLAEVQSLLSRCRAPVAPRITLDNERSQAWYPWPRPINIRHSAIDLLYRPLQEKPSTGNDATRQQVPDESQWIRHIHSIVALVEPAQSVDTRSHSIQQSFQPSETSSSSASELQEIISHFAKSTDPVRSTYGQDLNRSLSALRQRQDGGYDYTSLGTPRVNTDLLQEAIVSCRKETQVKSEFLYQKMVEGHHWLELGGLLPARSPLTLLEVLRDGPQTNHPGAVQAGILSYAESLMKLQQLLRIQDAHRRKDIIRLLNERQNAAHTSWKPRDHIDWLLLELDFNLIIRRDQVQVAQAMIASPSTASNFVLQMNMGQGKSSIIIPMVATALARDENLVRVVVPRSLLLQAGQLLSSRLGGLINRKLKHVPFSRKSPTDLDTIRAYHQLHIDVQKGRGVLLALPEHLLSFQLSGKQELSNGHTREAKYMIRIQAWFARKARDVLDECDHMLAVQTQLIYPSGSQSPVDGHPDRWKFVQGLLKLTRGIFDNLRREYPRSIEIIPRAPGAFPTVYFLDQTIKDQFMRRLTDSVLRGDGGLIPIQECSMEELASASDFLRQARFAKSSAPVVAQIFKHKKQVRLQILLLRGLLVHRILLMGLSKRWNVQYGIHPLRDPVAVPFRSKGMPSDQAEFGHPDVSILLTCLSFYHTGLNFAQFQQSLGLLLKSDEPGREYASWIVQVEKFPQSLSAWDSINIDDETQCVSLWNHLRLQMTTIDFFLNHFVFPRHAKTFDRKLVSSGE